MVGGGGSLGWCSGTRRELGMLEEELEEEGVRGCRENWEEEGVRVGRE